jgi:hypothetical protein
LAELQQQLLGGYVAANSPSATNSTDGAGQASPLALFGGDDSTSWSGNTASTNSTDPFSASPTGSPLAFGPGILSAILAQLEQQTAGSGAAATAASATGNGTDTTGNATDTTTAASNSTDGATNDPIAQAIFSAIDTNGDGTISESELETAFTSNGGTVNSADALYTKLAGSSNSSDGITLSQFEASLPQPGGPGGPGGVGGGGFGGHHHDFGGEGGGAGQASSASGAAGSTNGTTQTVTNADGSTTTTITYADGTTVTITEPAAVANASSSASNSTDASGTGNGTDTINSQWLTNFEQYMTKLLDAQNALFNNNSIGNQLTLSV